MADASETGCRLTARMPEAPAKLGDLLAMRRAAHGRSASCGGCSARRPTTSRSAWKSSPGALVPVLLRSWTGATADGRAGAGRPFLGIYLPAHPENRQAAQRSLIGPSDKLVSGGMIELDTGKARYLIRFTQILEQQPGWSWVLFNAVRNLSREREPRPAVGPLPPRWPCRSRRVARPLARVGIFG